MRFIVSFLAAPLLVYGLFVLLPALNAFRYSLSRWDGLSAPVWTGLKNFQAIVASGNLFVSALKHNLFLMFMPGVFVLSLALFFANCIHQRIRGARLFRIAFFFPNVISAVAVSLLWRWLYSTTNIGIVNHLLVTFHIRKEPFPFTDSSNLLWSLIPMIVWGATGFYMVLFLAAMENIPETYYEAAQLDGATPSQIFFRITLPLIWEVLTTGIIFLIIGGLKVFDTVWVMENGRPNDKTHTMSTLMYSKVFEEYNIGQGTAIAVLLFVFVLIATRLSQRFMQSEALEY
jgi:ABC-type sugar transport system permease subunit